MKTKLFTFAILALFLVGVVSAASLAISNQVIPTSVNQDVGTLDITFDLTNSGLPATINWNGSFVNETGAAATFVFSDNTIGDGSVTPVTVPITATINFDTSYSGTLSGEIIADPSGSGSSKTLAFSVEILDVPEEQDICGTTAEGSLEVDIQDISVDGFGEDDEFWYLFDEIEVEVEITNKNDDEKIKDIEIEWGLYSESADEWVIELDEEDEIDLKKDSEDTITFTFQLDDDMDVDIEDIEGGDLTLYVVAKGEEQEEPEFDVCASDSQTVELRTEDDFIILNNIRFTESVTCGETVEVTADVWNIGEGDQEDVYVVIDNDDLGLNNKRIDIGDVDALDREKLEFTFELPEDAEESYQLKFTVYDEDDDVFENDEDDKAEFNKRLEVSDRSSCKVPETIAMTASIESEAVAGKEMVIKATLTNIGDEERTYQVILTGYDSWASLDSYSPTTVTLGAGESQDITVTMVPNKDAAGDNEFIVQTVYSGNIEEQKISVPVEASRSWLTGGAIGSAFGDNWFVWMIAALNVILVILIIIVAIRVARKSAE